MNIPFQGHPFPKTPLPRSIPSHRHPFPWTSLPRAHTPVQYLGPTVAVPPQQRENSRLFPKTTQFLPVFISFPILVVCQQRAPVSRGHPGPVLGCPLPCSGLQKCHFLSGNEKINLNLYSTQMRDNQFVHSHIPWLLKHLWLLPNQPSQSWHSTIPWVGLGGVGMENLGSLFPLPLGAAGPGDRRGERVGRPAAAGPALGHQQWHLLGLERTEAALVRAAPAH